MKRLIRLTKELLFSIFKIKNFWVYIFCRARLSKKNLVKIRLRNGVSYYLEPGTNQAFMINEIWHLGIYNPLLKFVGPGSTIIDIGANIGIFSIKAARLNDSVKVFSFEPLPQNFKILKQNIALSKLEKRIFPFELAVSGKVGTEELHFKPFDSGGASFKHFGDETNSSSLVVKTLRLEDVFSQNGIENCDFLKIDCEGAEEDILTSAPPSLFKKIRSMSIEWHYDINVMSIDKFREFLAGLNYQVSYDPSTLTFYAWR